MKQYGLNSAEYIKCLFIDYLLSKDEDSIIGNEFMYGIKRKLVDLVVLKKHKTIAVEVKSNNDNLIRLEEQIKEYAGAEIDKVLELKRFYGEHDQSVGKNFCKGLVRVL